MTIFPTPLLFTDYVFRFPGASFFLVCIAVALPSQISSTAHSNAAAGSSSILSLSRPSHRRRWALDPGSPELLCLWLSRFRTVSHSTWNCTMCLFERKTRHLTFIFVGRQRNSKETSLSTSNSTRFTLTFSLALEFYRDSVEQKHNPRQPPHLASLLHFVLHFILLLLLIIILDIHVLRLDRSRSRQPPAHSHGHEPLGHRGEVLRNRNTAFGETERRRCECASAMFSFCGRAST